MKIYPLFDVIGSSNENITKACKILGLSITVKQIPIVVLTFVMDEQDKNSMSPPGKEGGHNNR